MPRRSIVVLSGCAGLVLLAGFALWMRAQTAQPPPAIQTIRTVSAVANKLVLHAREATKIEKPFVLLDDPTGAAGKVVAVPPKAGTAPGAFMLPFTIESPGKYMLWLHVYWGTDGDGSCSDSVQISLDSAPGRTVQDGTYEAWHWLPLKRESAFDLAAGSHHLLFSNREDGIKFDQVLIAPWDDDESARYVPQGIE